VKYTIVADRYPLKSYERVIEAPNEKEALKRFWDAMSSEQKDSIASLDVVEIEK
jgi:hypothetical protein